MIVNEEFIATHVVVSTFGLSVGEIMVKFGSTE